MLSRTTTRGAKAVGMKPVKRTTENIQLTIASLKLKGSPNKTRALAYEFIFHDTYRVQ